MAETISVGAPTGMSLLKGISTLTSVRGFKSEPVPRDRIKEMLEATLKSVVRGFLDLKMVCKSEEVRYSSICHGPGTSCSQATLWNRFMPDRLRLYAN